jgi:hypothetical protein
VHLRWMTFLEYFIILQMKNSPIWRRDQYAFLACRMTNDSNQTKTNAELIDTQSTQFLGGVNISFFVSMNPL